MGASSSTTAPPPPPAAANSTNACEVVFKGDGTTDRKPSCKICCACPEERRKRDECTLLKNMDECKVEIDAFYNCLLREGFPEKDVEDLRRRSIRL